MRDALSQRQMFTMFQHLGFHHVSPSNYWYYVVLFIGTIGFTPFFTMGDWVSPSFSTKIGDLGAIAASESGLQHLGMRQLGAGPVLRAAVSNQLRRHLHWRPGRGMGWMGWNDLQHFDHFQAFGDVCDRLLPGLQHQSQPLGGMDPTQLQADDLVGTVICRCFIGFIENYVLCHDCVMITG